MACLARGMEVGASGDRCDRPRLSVSCEFATTAQCLADVGGQRDGLVFIFAGVRLWSASGDASVYASWNSAGRRCTDAFAICCHTHLVRRAGFRGHSSSVSRYLFRAGLIALVASVVFPPREKVRPSSRELALFGDHFVGIGGFWPID